MNIKLQHPVGDKLWIADPRNVREVTVAKVMLTVTATDTVEMYQCEETGTNDSSTWHVFGHTLFATQKDADAYIESSNDEWEARVVEWNRQKLLASEPSLREQLRKIEEIKNVETGANG